MRIIYHNADLDGKCSAAIAYWSPEANAHRSAGMPVQLIGMNYGDRLEDWGQWPQDEKVFVLDFSLPIQEMVALAKHCTLVWLDHHKTARDEAEAAGFKPLGERGDDKTAACLLAWEWFHPGAVVPEAVSLIGAYDVWNHSAKQDWDLEILPFQMGLMAKGAETEPDSQLWLLLLDPVATPASFWNLQDDGEAILRHMQAQNRELVDKAGVAVEIGGRKAYAVNRLWSNSELFKDAELPAGTEVLAAFGWERSRWRVTLWPLPGAMVDVAAIAKEFGGGGHPGAAGFQCLELPFRLG